MPQDALLAAWGSAEPLLVDVNSPGLVGERIVARARALVPERELMIRYESGLTHAAAEILAGRLDASFGRFAGLAPGVAARLEQQPVRYEPMVLVLPGDHPLAGLSAVPLAALAGHEVYAGDGNPRTEEWTDLARRLFAPYGVLLAPPAPLAVGEAEFARIMAKRRCPVLAVRGFPAMTGTVSRPLVDPVPLSPVSLVWRRGRRDPALDALRRAARDLASEESWLIRPDSAWLPTKDALIMVSRAENVV
ncbi:LysR substrate-binding domain-containing protein [Streptomyces sp. NPDC049954]|uniref:LysR substrate-binding domain-containing protein n=1 Tax=Streptomyces sp. NPDC049954 TaxID=3155779 RepID=UPI003416E402